jgi:hypothetical protein
MKYRVTIETLDHQVFQYDVESSSKSSTLCERIFNQTPNVRSVEVNQKINDLYQRTTDRSTCKRI